VIFSTKPLLHGRDKFTACSCMWGIPLSLKETSEHLAAELVAFRAPGVPRLGRPAPIFSNSFLLVVVSQKPSNFTCTPFGTHATHTVHASYFSKHSGFDDRECSLARSRRSYGPKDRRRRKVSFRRKSQESSASSHLCFAVPIE